MWTPKIDAQGFSAKFYLWYTLKYSLPKGYCKFFWTLVLAYVLIIPYLILSLPAIIVAYFSKDFESECFNKTIDRVFFGLFFYSFLFIIFVLFAGITFICNKIPEKSFWVEFGKAGITLWLVLITILIGIGIQVLSKSIAKKRKNVNKVKNANPIVGTFKAIYKKYCPQIEWYNLKNK